MRHEQILDRLEQRIAKLCIYHDRESQYVTENGKQGEYDLMGMTKYQEIMIFEVKTNDTDTNRQKAEQQLIKDYEHFRETYDTNKIKLFYAYSDKHMRRKYNVEEYTPITITVIDMLKAVEIKK